MSSKNTSAPYSVLHPPVGTRIGGNSIELVEVLGVGGYGVVYRGVDVRAANPRSYAVKCLIYQGHQASRQRQIHLREINLHQLASTHPGVVSLHRVIEDENMTYIIMDYAPDHDLFTQILHSCRYLGDDQLIKNVFLQILDAVEYCHSLGIYHRDLKPENILCFDDGLRVSVTDFGLATTDQLSEEFRTGSVYHMSPECQGGDYAPTGNYSPMFNDIWSLGIILLNLATGRNPWKSATAEDPTFQTYLQDPYNFLPTVLPISAEVNDILTRMLEVDWRERATLPEIRMALEEVTTFYSDGVIFEGSMARCPWEEGMDVDDSDSSTQEDVPAPPSKSDNGDARSRSLWSKESSVGVIIANRTLEDQSSYGRWEEFASYGLDYRKSPPSQSYRNFSEMDTYDRPHTPLSAPCSLSSTDSESSSLPNTPGKLAVTFAAASAEAEPRKGLTIDTNYNSNQLYHANDSVTIYSASSEMVPGTLDDPSSYFLSSSAILSRPSITMPGGFTFEHLTLEDKEMSSPSMFTTSPVFAAPFTYSQSSSEGSLPSRTMSYDRSQTGSPDSFWHRSVDAYNPQPQGEVEFSEPSQLSPSILSLMTNISPPSRPVLSSKTKQSYANTHGSIDQGQTKTSTTTTAKSFFDPVRTFFTRSTSPPVTPTTQPRMLAYDGYSIEPFQSYTRDQAYLSPSIETWFNIPSPIRTTPESPIFDGYRMGFSSSSSTSSTGFGGGGGSAPIPIPLPRRCGADTSFVRASKWFSPGKFFTSMGIA
ncbi:kinase-like protein [Pluteus cervinus]|uniref:Kinase-like protein n=1 Tax=Pluteus cervinus TaxID=181527 RepID=A0ACD3B1V2_9AGAR|nr:kinase-like protein [Pluteus cervinus]